MGHKAPKIVCLCGSSRFVDMMAIVSWLIERDEGKITMGLHLLPRWYPNVPAHHLAESEGVADQMDELHLRKIDLADEVYVIDYGGYIGESTANEIEYATVQNKPIRYLSKEPRYLNFVRAALEANDDFPPADAVERAGQIVDELIDEIAEDAEDQRDTIASIRPGGIQ